MRHIDDLQNGQRTTLDTDLKPKSMMHEELHVEVDFALDDYDLVKCLLLHIAPVKGRRNLTKTLIDRFGSFAEIISAPTSVLIQVPGMTPSVAQTIQLIRKSALYLIRKDILRRPILSDLGSLLDYLYATLSREKKEQARVLFLNRKNHLLADELHSTGTVDRCPIYVREIVKRALELGGTAIIVVHNHPSGDPTPSQDDIYLTRELLYAAELFSIELHDHMVVGKEGIWSFRRKGLIQAFPSHEPNTARA